MYQYQRNPLDEVKNFFKRKSLLSRLIVINLAVFLIVNIINLFYWLFNVQSPVMDQFGDTPLVYYLTVPSDFNALLMRPWSIITYMFLQQNFFHLFFNMFVLYFGGRIFTEYLSEKKMLGTYLWGGITGAFFFMLAYNVFPVFESYKASAFALGASASVLAILVAISTYVPNYTVILFIFGRIKLKYLAIVLVIIDLLSIQRGNPGGHIAHLGGALWGFVSIMLMKRGYDMNKFFDIFNFKKLFKPFLKPKSRKYSKKGFTAQRPTSDDEYNYRKARKQEKIDQILEKISKSGYESLTKEEKELLFSASNKD